jgi:ribosomal protein S18 acetylase RimI-like enzyme
MILCCSNPATPSGAVNGNDRLAAATRIRPAAPADCERLTDLADMAYERYVERMGKKPAPMTEDYAQRIAEGTVFVLEVLPAGASSENAEPRTSFSASSAVIGFIVLLPEKDVLLLDNVAVDPAAQGRGYGKLLMAFAEHKARAAGLGRIALYANEAMTENLQFYHRLDYTETRRATEKGFRRVFFSKYLL